MSFLNKIRVDNTTLTLGREIWKPAEANEQTQDVLQQVQEVTSTTPPVVSPNPYAEETGLKELDELIDIFGYDYDPKQDIFISKLRPWQRYIGYCRLFDELSAPTGMIIDCEPIHFEYQGKKWMISFWKGQYDMVTGGEIGFYKSALKYNMPGVSSGIIYNAVDDEDLLDMSYVLKKHGKVILTRKAKHWWLTGFKLGEFSQPDELTMDISVTLKDTNMCNAFLAGMRDAGYSNHELTVRGNTVSFTFNVPRTPQPLTRTKFTDDLIQKKNKFLCDKYNEITGEHLTVQEKIKALEEQAPDIFKRIKKMGKKSKNLEGWLTIIIITLVVLYLIGGEVTEELLT